MASNPNIPDEVVQFIHRFITSVAQLEALLLIAAKEQREWTVEAVSDELRSGHALMAEVLSSLEQAGLLSVSGDQRYCYAPGNGVLRRQVDALATLYRERRHSVMSAIYERPTQNTDPIRAFSDAFRLRDPKGQG